MNNLDDFIDILRRQRHDFMNDVQVIYGYLQIDKQNEAIKYIERLCEQNKVISEIYALQNNSAALCLERNIRKLWTKDRSVIYDSEITLDDCDFTKDHDKKCSLIDNIFDEFENNDSKYIYIYIYEDSNGKNITVSNDESIIYDESTGTADSWREVKSVCGLKLFQICDGEAKGCKLLFYNNER